MFWSTVCSVKHTLTWMEDEAGAWGQMSADSAWLVERIQITHFQGPTARGLSDAAAHACVKMKAC